MGDAAAAPQLDERFFIASLGTDKLNVKADDLTHILTSLRGMSYNVFSRDLCKFWSKVLDARSGTVTLHSEQRVRVLLSNEWPFYIYDDFDATDEVYIQERGYVECYAPYLHQKVIDFTLKTAYRATMAEDNYSVSFKIGQFMEIHILRKSGTPRVVFAAGFSLWNAIKEPPVFTPEELLPLVPKIAAYVNMVAAARKFLAYARCKGPLLAWKVRAAERAYDPDSAHGQQHMAAGQALLDGQDGQDRRVVWHKEVLDAVRAATTKEKDDLTVLETSLVQIDKLCADLKTQLKQAAELCDRMPAELSGPDFSADVRSFADVMLRKIAAAAPNSFHDRVLVKTGLKDKGHSISHDMMLLAVAEMQRLTKAVNDAFYVVTADRLRTAKAKKQRTTEPGSSSATRKRPLSE